MVSPALKTNPPAPWGWLLEFVPRVYRPVLVLLAVLIALGLTVRNRDLAAIDKKLDAKADTGAVNRDYRLLLQLNLSIDSLSLREQQFFCDQRPKWCR